MTADEARAYVDYLYAALYQAWREKIHASEFMTRLREGSLPLPVIRQFFKNWGRFSLEVNGLNAVSYYTHLPFFVRNFDLLGPFCAKIADELISPRPPGHVLVLLQTAEAMGLSRKEILEDPYLPAARAINDFCHKIFLDGSIVELWGLHVFEESLSQWSGEWYTALTTRYGFTREQAVYFSTHEEADLETHALGQGGEQAMGHGAFNRAVLTRALQDTVEFRAGYSLEYCALTMIDLHAQMKRAALEHPYP
ncbi:MAG TPA: iron-containing redox enzyme family protein [candidate division Zixibacteria bacterium]|nr:iron-containing redox enzyme family protein [candidate division Zixibacteria bacterium]